MRSATSAAISEPGRLIAAYASCEPELAGQHAEFYSGLDDDSRAAVWAMLIAHRYRPYGGSMAFSLADLLQEKQLDCDNYVFLTIRLFRVLRPDSKLDLDFVGWEGGMVGNHAQLIVNHPTVSLLLDPTVGIAAKIGFDDLASGKAVQTRHLLELSDRDDPPGFRNKVKTALLTGDYRPSHILYYFSDPDDLVKALPNINNWPTPAIQERDH